MTKVTAKEVKNSNDFKRGDIVTTYNGTLVIVERVGKNGNFSGFQIKSGESVNDHWLNTYQKNWIISSFKRFIGTVTLESS